MLILSPGNRYGAIHRCRLIENKTKTSENKIASEGKGQSVPILEIQKTPLAAKAIAETAAGQVFIRHRESAQQWEGFEFLRRSFIEYISHAAKADRQTDMLA